jgi:hypothetical protein
VVEVKDRLRVNKHRSQRFHVENMHLKELNEAGDKNKYRFESRNKFPDFADLDAEVLGERLGRIKKFGQREEGCSDLLNQWKQANCSGYRIQVK